MAPKPKTKPCSKYRIYYVRFQVLTVVSMKFRVFWDVAPCIHVEVDRRFRGVYCLHHQSDESPWWWRQYTPLKRRSMSTWLHSTTSQKTKCHTHCREDLKSQTSSLFMQVSAYIQHKQLCLKQSFCKHSIVGMRLETFLSWIQ